MLKKNKAFTITELVIVIAVIAILAAVMIPTFSGVIESAKVSTDTANAGILSTELKVALMNSEETITEANAHRLLKEEFAAGKSGGIVPQSAGYGYHFVYNFNNGTIEVKHISEITKSATQSLNVGNGGVDLSNWGNVPETCFLNNGYFLLDTAGSALAEVVNNIYTVASASDLTAIATSVVNNLTKDYAAAGQHIKAYLDTVVFIGNGADFTTAADRSDVKNVVFVSQVEQITSVVNTVGESAVKQSVADYDNPVATLNSGTVVEIPSSVKEISRNALVFAVSGEDSAQHNEQSIRLHFAAGIDQVVQGLDIGFTNCEFTFGDDKMIYHLSDDGTQILNEKDELVATLETKYPVTDFDIRIVGVDSEDVLSVALDSFADGIGSYQFEAYNFMSGDNPFASNTSVRWEVASDTSSSASITQDGLLTFTKPGEIVVKATSDENPEITATFTVRIGGVINTSGIEFTGIDGNLEIVDAVTSKITVINGQPAVINYSVTVNTNFEIEGIDKSYTVTSSAENAVVNQDGTISVNGAGNFTITLTFNSYHDIVVTHNFIVEEKLQSFECIAQELPNIGQYLYKVGNLNAFDITRLWQFTGLHKDEGLNDSDIEISYNIINAKDNQSIDSTWYTLEDNKLKFIDFQGVVRVEITATADGVELNQIVVPLEVLDGYNVTTETELFNTTNNSYNKMIMNDIVLTSYRSNGTYVVNGATLYGNGFTLNGNNDSTFADAQDPMSWDALVSVKNAVVDNIRITGPVFPEVNLHQEPYSCYTLYVTGDGSTDIYNSYFSGSRAAAYVEQNAYIYNTVFEGGALANVILRCKYIVLDDVTTIRKTITTEDLNGSKLNLDNIVSNGLGLGFYIESNFANEIKIVLKGDLRQYNWIDTGLRNEVDSGFLNAALESELKDLVNKATTAGMIHSIGGKEYVNTGFAFAAQVSNISSTIVDMRSDEIKSQAMYSKFEYTSEELNFTGTIYSLLNTSNITSTSDRFVVTDEYKMPRLESMEVSPSIRKVNPLIEETQISDEIKAQLEEFSFDINDVTGNFNIKLPQGKNFVFTNEILRGIVNVKLYNEDLTAFVQLVVPNGENVDGSINYKSVDSIELTRANHTAVFAAKVSVSNRYDANGNPLATSAMNYYFEFEINATFDLQKATSNIRTDGVFDSTGTEGNFMYLKYESYWILGIPTDHDYLTAAYLFNGMTITDYMLDEDGNEVSYQVDFSNITVGEDGQGNLMLVYKNDDAKLGVKAGDKHQLQISAFNGGNMASPSSYSIKVYDDGKIMIHSVNGADNRTDECDMKITFTYKCNNNKDVLTLKRVYDFKGTYGILNKCDTPTNDRNDYGV